MKIIVVSELGVNHDGDMDKLEKMVYASRDSGVDAVKLQYYDVDKLEIKGSLKERLAKAQLTLEQIKTAKEIAESCKLKFLCTPMSSYEKAKELSEIGLDWVKIREKDSYNYGLIKKTLPLFKRVYISTTRRPVDMFLLYHPKIYWLYVIPEYPASISDIDLDFLRTYDGYSNHVPGIVAPFASCVMARFENKPEWYLEVHFTLDHNLNDIDDNVSLDVDELTRLVELVRELEV